MNFLSLDCPNLQFPVKQSAKEMSKPVRGSWKRMKKVARYLVGVERVVIGQCSVETCRIVLDVNIQA